MIAVDARRRGPPGRSGCCACVGSWSVDAEHASSAPPPARIPAAKPRQRCVEPGVADLLVDAQRVADAGARHPPPALEPRPVLGLADVGEDAEVAEAVAAGVDRDDRDAGALGAPDRRRAAPATSGSETTSPSSRAGDRLVDQPAHARDVVACRARGRRRRRRSGARVVDALLDDRPERVRRLAVADDRDPRRRRAAGRAPRSGVASGDGRLRRAAPRRAPRGRARAPSSCRRSPASATQREQEREQPPHAPSPFGRGRDARRAAACPRRAGCRPSARPRAPRAGR